MNLKETYNKIAQDWNTDHANDTWWVEGTDHLVSLLPKNASILDVGCGGGHKVKYLSDKEFKVTGIDFSEEMIEHAQKYEPRATFKVLDIYDLDSMKEKFDCVFAQAVLLHIPKSKILEALAKFKKVAKPNGLVYVAVKEVKSDGIEEKVVTENDYGYDYERFFSFFNQEELRKDFEKVGLEVVWENVANSGKTNWLQIIGKNI
jgi:SAM-dependent methyltransferase